MTPPFSDLSITFAAEVHTTIVSNSKSWETESMHRYTHNCATYLDFVTKCDLFESRNKNM